MLEINDVVLYCIVLYCSVLYCIVLYCIVLYCIVLYCIVIIPNANEYDVNFDFSVQRYDDDDG